MALVMEFCDAGSLCDAIVRRVFLRQLKPTGRVRRSWLPPVETLRRRQGGMGWDGVLEMASYGRSAAPVWLQRGPWMCTIRDYLCGVDGSARTEPTLPCPSTCNTCDCLPCVCGALLAPADPTARPAKPQMAICMRSVFATLLEVALALRHMHSLHLVHCDVSHSGILAPAGAT